MPSHQGSSKHPVTESRASGTSGDTGRTALLHLLVFMSGAAALAYEVVWHRYLSILLGAQAKATAVVLAVFLGGLGAGYALFGHWCRTRNWNLLKAYCSVEGLLALWGFCFPWFFALAQYSVGRLYGVFGAYSTTTDIAIAIALMGFPTFLMGGTLPLLTQGFSTGLRGASTLHARVYGFNTVGACFGAILTETCLLPYFGFAGTTRFAALLNVGVAAAAYVAFARKASKNVQAQQAAAWNWTAWKTYSSKFRMLLAVAFLSGFYMIALQTVLIRLMGLSAGSSGHHFAIVVAVFIFCIGIGSLLVKRLDDKKPEVLLRNQIWVTIGLSVLYFTCDHWPWGAHVLRAFLRDIPQNYYVYQLHLLVALLGLLFIPLWRAGLTLPLCFHIAKDNGAELGHRVGQLYSVNTWGSIASALLGGYFLLNWIDLDHVFKLCVLTAACTLVLATIYVHRETPLNLPKVAGVSTGLAAAAYTVVFAPAFYKPTFFQAFRAKQPLFETFSPSAFKRRTDGSVELLHWKDDPNTSIGVFAMLSNGKEVSRSMLVNGKSDGNTVGDVITMLAVSHLPALLAAKTESAAVIGFGTGMSAAALLAYDQFKEIDLAEISPDLLKSASFFKEANADAINDPRLKTHPVDALRMFVATDKTYDVIVSEPSNPWVAGVENLFTEDFYKLAASRMNRDGIFAQWIQTYAFNEELLGMVLAAMQPTFPHMRMFFVGGSDAIILGSFEPIDSEHLARAQRRFDAYPRVRASLEQTGVTNLAGLFAFEIVGPATPAAIALNRPRHTLLHPRLSQGAAAEFFLDASLSLPDIRTRYPQHVRSLQDTLLRKLFAQHPPDADTLIRMERTICLHEASKSPRLCDEALAAKAMRENSNQTGLNAAQNRMLASARTLQSLGSPTKKPFTVAQLRDVHTFFDQYRKTASPVMYVEPAKFLSPLEHCLKTVAPAQILWGECALQKFVVLNSYRNDPKELKTTLDAYVHWYRRLSPEDQRRPVLMQAYYMLVANAKQP